MGMRLPPPGAHRLARAAGHVCGVSVKVARVGIRVALRITKMKRSGYEQSPDLSGPPLAGYTLVRLMVVLIGALLFLV
jgi:hypothetical protein